MGPTRVFALNVHADYACRHSGACCTAGWSIPVEPHLRALVGRAWLTPVDGTCPEYDATGRRCRIHRTHGDAMLPVSCFQFPRRALVDARGTFVTLSHFCPTAAARLVDCDAPLTIVADPPAFPAGRDYDALDGRGEWPPLVQPGLLFDHESYAAWERFVIQTLGSPEPRVAATLDRVACAAEQLRCWTPARGPLRDWVDSVVYSPCASARPGFYDRYSGTHAYAIALDCVPADLQAPVAPDALDEGDEQFVARRWDAMARPVLRYVATKAFASWSAYQARGVRTQVAELLVSAAVLRVECVRACVEAGRELDRDTLLTGVRAADWLLMHLVDRRPFVHALGEVEGHAAAPAHD